MIRPVFSLEKTFEPYTWYVPEQVAPVFNSETGEFMAYVFDTAPAMCHDRDSLPTEIFNHELKSLDLDNPVEIAAFMSEYGWIGKPHYFFDDEFVRVVSVVNDLCECGSHYVPDGASVSSMGYDEIETVHRVFGRDLMAEVQELWPFPERVKALSYCTYSTTDRILRRFMDTADAARALIGSDNLGESAIKRACRTISDSLEGIHPMLGYVIDSGAPRFPDDDISGSFEQALSLQLWNFVLIGSKEGYRVCTRCGNVFVQKRSESKRTRKASAGGNSFCCDKCKSAYTSRMHRMTPGYLQKQERAAKAKKELDTHIAH